MTQHARAKTNNGAVRPIKSLGQNFLRDASVVRAIVDGAAIGEDDLVIEVGPGTGALTVPAAAQARRLVAIELDRHVLPTLQRQIEAAGLSNVEVIREDFLRVDLAALIRAQREIDPQLAGVSLLGNLPYYITTPIIMKVLEEEAPLTSMTVMMQREVADRIFAEVGTKAYGALTVAVGYYCTVEKVVEVPRTCFYPVPKVDSTVLRLVRRETREVAPVDERRFFSCIRTAFSMRRKTLANCFTGYDGMDKEEAARALSGAGIDPLRRGETLTVEEYARLADHLAARHDIDLRG